MQSSAAALIYHALAASVPELHKLAFAAHAKVPIAVMISAL